MPARRILVVSYPYPPMPSVGGNRWLAITKYLRRMGHETTVLTTSAFGSLVDDTVQGVRRAADLTAWPAVRRALRRPPLPEPGASAPPDSPPPSWQLQVLVPDPYVLTWVPAAAAAARRIVRERAIDCVVTTSPHESTHVVGFAARGPRTAWIADFRDGWTFDSVRAPFPSRPQRWLDGRLERAVVRGADRVTCAPEAVASDFRHRLGIDAAHLPNGYDPELADEGARLAGADRVPELDPSRLSLVHTGKLSGVWGRTPAPFFEAVRLLRRRDPAIGARLQVVLAGRLDDHEIAMLEGLDGVVEHVGHVSRAASLALQRRADALLLITSRLRSEATGKVYEYLGAGRPVLALADGNEAARMIERTGTGLCVPPDDAAAIAQALEAALDGALARAYSPHDLDRFVYPAPAERMAEEVERAVESRRGAS